MLYYVSTYVTKLHDYLYSFVVGQIQVNISILASQDNGICRRTSESLKFVSSRISHGQGSGSGHRGLVMNIVLSFLCLSFLLVKR